MNEDNIGYPIYRMNEIHNMFCDLQVDKFADISNTELQTFKLNDRDVLFNRTNSFEWVGRTGLYRKINDNDYIFASYLVRFIPDENFILPEYLTAFLNSKQGIWDIKRRARQSINQTNVNPEEVKEIEIPLLSMVIQQKIKFMFDISHEKRVLSDSLYKEAEELLLKELDLLDFKTSEENIAIKSFKESFGTSGRLDSEYYQPKYDQIEKTIRERGKYTYIKNEFNHIKTSFDKSKDGYNYIEIGNVNISDGTNISNYVEIKDLPANAKINVKNGDLLVSTVRPYRGAVTIINNEEDDLIVSGAFTVLRKRENSNINTQVLQVLLRTNIYKELLLKYNVGTQYPVIKDEDVLNLIIPNIDETIQTLIEEKIKKSFELKEESKKLLDLAKRVVEVSIEKNEDESIKIIDEVSL